VVRKYGSSEAEVGPVCIGNLVDGAVLFTRHGRFPSSSPRNHKFNSHRVNSVARYLAERTNSRVQKNALHPVAQALEEFGFALVHVSNEARTAATDSLIQLGTIVRGLTAELSEPYAEAILQTLPRNVRQDIRYVQKHQDRLLQHGVLEEAVMKDWWDGNPVPRWFQGFIAALEEAKLGTNDQGRIDPRNLTAQIRECTQMAKLLLEPGIDLPGTPVRLLLPQNSELPSLLDILVVQIAAERALVKARESGEDQALALEPHEYPHS
jgi:hypothetical protein